MKLVLSLNKKEYLYDYVSMGIEIFVLGGKYSLHSPYTFSLDEISEIIEKYPQCLFYVTMNALYDQHELKEIEDYIQSLNDIHVKGIIFQDFGILQIVKENDYNFDMMYSPETLNLGSYFSL